MLTNLKDIKNIFPTLDPELLSDIEKNAAIIQFTEGEDIMKTGQNIKSTLLVLNGLIKVSREDDNGKEIFMYHLEPGQACALSILCAVQNRKSEIKATAVKETEVLAIPIQYVDQWMKEHKSWYQFVLATYRERFEELLNTIDAIAFAGMDKRLENYLKNQVKQLGNNIKITHQQIANDLSSSREVISRLLKKMETKGWLIIDRNSIEWLKKN
ncbi:MAG TPA: Crp/Fnr family transcriptional regulator [Chitinophagaceae bacterium]